MKPGRVAWHDRTVNVPVLAVFGTFGVLISHVAWLPAEVRGAGVLVGFVCPVWLLCKRRLWR